MSQKIRTYTELSRHLTFEERFAYLKLVGVVGSETFGFDRHLNQVLYRSVEWIRARDIVIIRDESCDLGVYGYLLSSGIVIHHMNPLTVEDITNRNPDIFNPEFLISCSARTHQAIHFSNESLLPKGPIERRPGDTIPWKRY